MFEIHADSANFSIVKRCYLKYFIFKERHGQQCAKNSIKKCSLKNIYFKTRSIFQEKNMGTIFYQTRCQLENETIARHFLFYF